MSLEDAITALTAAVKEQTAIITKGMASKATVSSAATTSAKPAAAAKKVFTEDDIKKEVGAYAGVDDPAERDKRKEFLKKLMAHYGVTRLGAVPPASIAELLGYIKQLAQGEIPSVIADAADSDEDSMV